VYEKFHESCDFQEHKINGYKNIEAYLYTLWK
jgi:hypothetical protein